MTLYEKILKLKQDTLKEKSLWARLKRDAYNSVITAIQNVGKDNYKEAKTDAYVIKVLKSEINAYKTANSHDKQYLEDCEFKAIVLEELVPEPISEQKLAAGVSNYKALHGDDLTIKGLLQFLDDIGYASLYDKQKAIKLLKGE